MQSALKLDHLDEVQEKRDRWARNKPLGQSGRYWSRSVKDKHAKETSNVLPLYLPQKEVPFQQRWRRLMSKLESLTNTLLETQIRRLVEKGNISQARSELSAIPMGTSEPLDKWKRLLAEPVVGQGTPASGQGMHENLLWLEKHSKQYRGKWVALKRGELLGSNPSSIALETQLEERDSLVGATFFKIEA